MYSSFYMIFDTTPPESIFKVMLRSQIMISTLYLLWVMLTSVLKILVKNSVKKSFYGKNKK